MAWSVQLSRWGDLPSILPTAFLGLVAGFVITRGKFTWPVKTFAPIVIGFAVIFWQGSIPVGEGDVVSRAAEAWERMFVWLRDAREGGINRDTVPSCINVHDGHVDRRIPYVVDHVQVAKPLGARRFSSDLAC